MTEQENKTKKRESEMEQDAQGQSGNYAAVALNAVKHGILSRLVVLPHEDAAEFSELLAELIAEHRPSGMTEKHLVEDLAAIMWRKRRVLLAEGAKIKYALKEAIENPYRIMPSAEPFQAGLSGERANLRELLTLTPEDLAAKRQYADADLKATQKAKAILYKGGENAYEKAKRALLAESREWWEEYARDEEFPENAEGLEAFILKQLEPLCIKLAQQARFTSEIKAQTLGEGLKAHQLEKLNRYETHLDRKFERTLAMLLKLKQIREDRGENPGKNE